MAVSRRLRYEILRRDEHTCRYCGAKAPDVKLTVDHVQPVSLGGPDEPTNLVTACVECNIGKSSSAPDGPIVDDVVADALRWAAAMKRVSQIETEKRIDAEQFCGGFASYWGDTYKLPNGWEHTVMRWVAMGLDGGFMGECIDAAFAQPKVIDRWRYFCGVVNTKLRQRQEKAAELIASGEV